MATSPWSISGRYHETCSCDFVCPCILTRMTARPSKQSCTFAMAMQIEHGSFDKTPLEGISFIVVGYTPGPMIEGNWSVGLIIDERASHEQRDAITAIVSGSAGGPMAPLSSMIGTFLGIDRAPIVIESSGVKWTAVANGLIDMGAEGAMGIDPSISEPMHIDNTGHPASNRMALARAFRSHIHALGVSWDDDSGMNNGHYAPFNWRSA